MTKAELIREYNAYCKASAEATSQAYKMSYWDKACEISEEIKKLNQAEKAA